LPGDRAARGGRERAAEGPREELETEMPDSTYVVVKDDLEKALRRFRRKVEKFGIRKAIRQHEYYEKPSERRRRRRRENERKRRKAERKNAR